MNQGFERGGGQPGFHFFQVMEARRAPHAQSVKQGQEGLRARFVRHLARGELAQFIVNRRQQVILSLGIADLGGIKDAHKLAHAVSANGQWLWRSVRMSSSISFKDGARQKRIGKPSGLKTPTASVVPSAENSG